MAGDAHLFRTDTVRAELRHRTMRSGAIAVGARLGSIAVQLGSVVVLARLLTPRDFGIQAMVLPLTILGNSMINLGLQTTVIQEEDLGPDAASAIWRLGLGVNLVLAALMAAGGALVARINATPEVTLVAVAWAAVVYLASTSAVLEAVLKRRLRFGVVWSAHMGATVVSVIAAIAAALAGAGYWALMVQMAVMELGRAATVWVASDWRPALRPRPGGVALRAMRGHWLRIGGFRVLSMSGDQLDRVVAGIVGGASVLGLYETSRRYAVAPFLDLFMSLSDVAVSSLSRVRHDVARYRRYLEYALLGILSISLPAITFLALDAGRIVLVLLGDQWLEAERFLRVMAGAAIAAALMRPMQWINLSRGETGRQLRWTLISTPVMMAGVLLGARYDAFGVAVGFTIAMALLVVPCIAYTIRGSPVGPAELVPAMGRPLGAAAAAGAAMLAAQGLWVDSVPRIGALALNLASFGALYAAAWLWLPGGRTAVAELWRAARELRAPPPARPSSDPVPPDPKEDP
ncbi:MAG: oligosaccharide flippase family protein [Gemmatimonadales bacterium]